MAKKAAVEEKGITPEELSKEFKEYSVAEFFKRNRQMLGYTGKVRSLTTVVHEYVTNSLDACEDARVLPDLLVEITELPDGHFKVAAEDNGTGIPKPNIGQALGQLLSGTKFMQRQQKRGQQGIGASYCTLFSQITTGKETHVKTSVGDYKVYECDVSIDINKNIPAIRNEKEYSGKFKGTRIETELAEVEYNRSAFGVYEYLRRTAIANPHAQITLVEPNKEITVFPRATKEIPKMPKKVLPHPLGITTSDLVDMAGVTDGRKIGSFLEKEFSRVSSERVAEIQSLMPKDPKTGKPMCDFDRSPKSLQWAEAEKIVGAIQKIKWIAPESDSLQPIGAKELEKSLKNLLAPEELRVIERPPKVFRGGISFMVEAAVAYGGKAGAAANQQNGSGNAGGAAGGETRGEAMRFANRVPLLFDAGACAIAEAVKTVDWARYDLKDWENLPVSIFVNFTSVYVPYTGAGKLAISAEEEIVTEIRQALMEAARGVAIYLREMRRAEEQEHRRSLFFRYINEVAQCLHDVTGTEKTVLAAKLKKLAEENTSLLEAQEADEEEGLEELEKAAEKELKGERGEDE
ncbi:DNA topoisomerase VI subunit B [Candidatus Micrarchaeota archaeon]|nr:DNA topoisomerase VI subunit B [Candidatus Micrarchaeota archaeon]